MNISPAVTHSRWLDLAFTLTMNAQDTPDHHCPGCRTSQRPFTRYPWYCCQACLGIACDAIGRTLVFGNASFSGGLNWHFDDDPDSGEGNGRQVGCLIAGRPVLVTEARFSGVVAQPSTGTTLLQSLAGKGTGRFTPTYRITKPEPARAPVTPAQRPRKWKSNLRTGRTAGKEFPIETCRIRRGKSTGLRWDKCLVESNKAKRKSRCEMIVKHHPGRVEIV